MKKMILFAAAVITLGACTNDENAAVEAIPSQLLISPVLTRVGDTSFDDGDQIGVTITMSSGDVYTTNALMTYSGGVFSGSLSWYSSDETSTVSAYYPYEEDGVPTSFTIQTDQTSGTSSSDLVAGKIEDAAPSEEAITINFTHQLSKVVVNVTNESDYEIDYVQLTGSKLTASVDVDSLSAEASSDSETGAITLYETTSGTTYEAIVVPQTVSFGVEITTTDGTTFGTNAASAELLQGYRRTINVTMSSSGIDVLLVDEVDDWEEGDDVGSLWYTTYDTRTFPYDTSFAYGAQNTYYVEQYASTSNSVTFDVKARVKSADYATGDTPIVSEPKYYKLILAGNTDDYTLLSIDDTDTDGYATVSDNYTITVNVASQASDSGSWGVVGLYDEDYTCLWTFMICKYLTEDPVTNIEYADISRSIMDRQLGFGTSTAKAIENGTIGTNGTAYFQYGRPTPFPYTNVGSQYKRAVLSESTSFATAMSNPTTIYVSDAISNYYYNWHYTSYNEDLWGGGQSTAGNSGSTYNTELTGTKTVYDPCPEGYRVPDEAFFYEVDADAELYLCQSGIDKYSYLSDSTANSPLSDADVYVYPLGDDSYDYWLFTGVIVNGNNSSAAYTTDRYDCNYGGIAYWGCHYYSVQFGCCFYRIYTSSANSTTGSYTPQYKYYKTRGMAVRCQLEE